MLNTSFRFDIAAILLASVLTVLGISAASAGGVSGGVLRDGKSASADRHQSGGQHRGGQHGGASAPSGGRGGLSGEF